MSGATTAVFDVGKTNVRLAVVDARGRAATTLSRANRVLPGPPYPHFDSEGLFEWLLEGLAQLAREHAIDAIVPVTHGACAALVTGDELALPLLDYECTGPEQVDDYEREARRFAETRSPALPAGQNLGRQLAWLEREHPRAFASAEHLLPGPGYWAWRLCGVPSCEVTSLGSHTDLWNPSRNAPSALARARGWDRLLPERAAPWTRLGGVTREVARAAGLRPGCTVLAGIHDSNASYFAHRAHRADPFCVVSTGTWVIALAHGGALETLREERDTLANVDAFGEATPTARFMGGREYAAIAGPEGLEPDAAPSDAELAAVLASGALAIPAFSAGGGPFPGCRGRVTGPELTTPAQRAALAALYCALVSDVCLDLLGARGDLIVEGRLARNDVYCGALASLRDEQRVLRSSDETGTLAGAALLARWPELPAPPASDTVTPLRPSEVRAHRSRWRAQIDRE